MLLSQCDRQTLRGEFSGGGGGEVQQSIVVLQSAVRHYILL